MTSTRRSASIGVFGITDAIDALLAPTLASLPMSLHPTAEPIGSISVIDGGSASWPMAVSGAVHSGAVAVFVLDPCLPGLDALDETIRIAAAVPVGLDLAWARNPALDGLRLSGSDPVRAVVANGSIGFAGGGDLVSATVDTVVAVTRAMGRPPSHLRLTHAEWSVSASGRWDDVVFRLSMVRSDAVGRILEISAHAARYTWVAQVPDPATASPAMVTVTGPEGARLLPTVYETSQRAGLRRLAEHLRGGQPTDDLATYRLALEATARALPRRRSAG